MNKLLIKFVGFVIPLNGVVSGYVGLKITPIITIFLLVTLIISRRRLYAKIDTLILFSLFMLCMAFQAIDRFEALVLLGAFVQYLTWAFICSALNRTEITCFFVGFTKGLLVLSLLFFGLAISGAPDSKIHYWQFGFPVNIGGYENPNGLAPFLMAGLGSWVIVRKFGAVSGKSTVGEMLEILILSSALIFTYSRAAWAAVSIFALIVFLVKFRWRGLISLFFIGPIFVLVFTELFSFVGQVDEVSGSVTSNKQGSIEARFRILFAIPELPYSITNVLVGHGIGASKELLADVIGQSLSLHNAFLAIFLEMGLFAFLVFVLICLAPFVLAVRRRRFFDAELKSYILLLLGIILMFYIYWLFHESYINSAFWVIYFMTMRLVATPTLRDGRC